jgi:hypothetical protein
MNFHADQIDVTGSAQNVPLHATTAVPEGVVMA